MCLSDWAHASVRQRLLHEADRLLDTANVSYAWGGGAVGDQKACTSCSQCLAAAGPAPKRQLQVCPVCRSCSLDCSHFIFEVFRRSKLPVKYLTTTQMRQLSPRVLKDRYNWIDIGARPSHVLAGDIVVYPGHVVLVERLTRPGVATVIHSTAGRVISGVGQGIQRQTMVKLSHFNGPIQRILRHSKIKDELKQKIRAKKLIRPSL